MRFVFAVAVVALVGCGPTPVPTPTPRPEPTATPTAEPTTLRQAAENWIEDNWVLIHVDLVGAVLNADFDLPVSDDLVAKAIGGQVSIEVRSKAKVAIDQSPTELTTIFPWLAGSENITIVASVEVEFETERKDHLAGLVMLPAVKGKVRAEKPYLIFLYGSAVPPGRFEEDVTQDATVEIIEIELLDLR